MPDDPTNPPSQPASPPPVIPPFPDGDRLYGSLVLGDEVANNPNGKNVITGTYNRMIVVLNPGPKPELGLPLPEMKLFIRVQGTREREIEVVLAIRVLEVNGRRDKSCVPVLSFSHKLSAENEFSVDGLLKIPTRPLIPKEGRLFIPDAENRVILQLESWIDQQLAGVARCAITYRPAQPGEEKPDDLSRNGA